MTERTVTNYVATPTGAKFMRSNAPVRLIMGPVGSGKSVVDIMEIARRAQEQAPARDGIRRTRWAIIRNTKQQLTDTTLKTWLDWFPDRIAGVWKESERTFKLKFGDVEAEVLFRALDDPDDVSRLLSLELTGAFVNEAREVPLEIIIALRSRVGRYPSKKEGGATWHGVFMDTNPPSVDHWIYEKFEVEKPVGWEIFKQPGGRSPNAENIENLPPTYYDDMCDGADEDFIKVHVDAEYGRSKAGMPVYENTFTPEFHLRDKLLVVRGAPVIIGMDFGRTPAAAFYQRDAKGRVLIQRECVSENMGLENFISQKVKPVLTEFFPGQRVLVGGDPAGWDKSQINEESCADVLKKMGFVAVRPATNRIAPRLAAVEGLLKGQIGGEAELLISEEGCPTIVSGFKHGYRYKRMKDGTFQEIPEKNSWSHPHDAVQYGAMTIDAGAMARALGNTAREVEKVSMRGWT